MNPFVSESYDEVVRRLALGLELVDAERGDRVAHPVSVAFDGVPAPLPPYRDPYSFGGYEITDVLPRVDRHDSCLHALVYKKGLYRPPTPPADRSFLTLRFLSPQRRFVPRRLAFQLLDPAPIAAADEANPAAGDPALLGPTRIRKVALFPGATYDAAGSATGLRGRCRSAADGTPVRWVRVEAYTHDAAGARVELVGRGQGDDRGEFLLLVWSDASGPGPLDLAAGVSLVVDVHAPPVPAVPPATRAADPLWDLPVETVTGAGPADPVSLGEAIPAGSTLVSRTESFVLGRCMTSQIAPFLF